MIPARTARRIPVLIAVCLLTLPAPAQYSGGSGTAGDPYRIATAADLIALGETPDDYDKHFILTADIDLGPNLPGRKVFDRAVVAPASSEGVAFQGVVEGGGHIVSCLTIDGGNCLGLFGCLGDEAEVRNLAVLDVNIVSHDDLIGSSGERAGGLAGWNEGTIANCCSTGVIRGFEYIGGLVGSNFGSVTASYSMGTIKGLYAVGGLMGVNTGDLSDCYTADTAILAHAGGGLVGTNRGRIIRCYSVGMFLDGRQVGGPGGGLAGSNYGDITASFWDTEISAVLNMCMTTTTDCDDSYGLRTAEMQTGATFLDAGWDFIGEDENGTDDVWKIVEGQTYPVLSWQKYGGGTGEPNDPYLIYTVEHLNALGAEPNDYDKHFKLMADVDLSAYVYDRAVIAPDVDDVEYGFQGTSFTGVFDGNDHTISNLTIEGKGYNLGLFGQVLHMAEIRDLGLVDVRVLSDAGPGHFVGGLAGASHGVIRRCHTSGRVSGVIYVGGLVGGTQVRGEEPRDAAAPQIIMNGCHSSASVTGHYHTGGLLGDNRWYDLADCHSTGTVSGGRIVGGLVGFNSADLVIQCYSAGTVKGDSGVGGLVGLNTAGIVTQCYNSSKISGGATVGGLIGSNSTDMDSLNILSYDVGQDRQQPVMTYCYNIGTVSGYVVGGLAGFNDGSIGCCYSTGAVYSTGNVGDDIWTGGLAGIDYGEIVRCFWDVETSGVLKMCGEYDASTSCDDSLGRPTAEMQTASTFLEAGWDFVGETANGTDDIWWILEGHDYPRLWWEPWN